MCEFRAERQFRGIAELDGEAARRMSPRMERINLPRAETKRHL